MAKSLSVRTKLSLLVALPLIPLLILAGISIHQKQAARSQAQDLRTLMSFATGIGSLAHDLQAERGMTVGFLSSRGARFAETLKNQQAQTDASISRLEAQLGDVLAAVTDKELRGSISATRQAVLGSLGELRTAAAGFQLSPEQALQRYSGLIQQLLDIPAYSVKLATDSELVGHTISYAFLLAAKESAGQTRAVLSDIFVTGHFTDASFQRFARLYASTDFYLELFLKYADEQTRTVYRDAMGQSQVEKAQRLRMQAMEQARAPNLTQVDPVEWFEAATALVNAMKRVEDHLSGSLMTMVQEIRASASVQLLSYLLIAGAVLLLTLVVALALVRVLSSSLSKVRAGLTEVAETGDLRTRVEVPSRDEVGQIAEAFNTMVESLQSVLGQVAVATASLNAQSEQLAAMSRATRNAADRQKNETHQSASAMNEMATTVQEVARNTSAAAAETRNATEEAGVGRQVGTEVMDAIDTLASEIRDAAEVITGLKQDSEAIGGILEVIREVAEQTNLLALNAAIEAARAGEQGRGFAVVADEVRTLASRTNASAQEIQQMIERVQGRTDQAVAVMDRSRQQAQLSVKKAADAGASLQRITGMIGQISDMNVQIASASEEQSAVAEEINRNILAIHRIAEENAAGTAQLEASSQELERLAHELQAGLAGFKL